MQVTQQVRNFMIDNSYTNLSEYNNETLIFKESILDSMGFLKLITFIENEFDIQILDDDLKEENFESINAISKYVTGMLSLREKSILR